MIESELPSLSLVVVARVVGVVALALAGAFEAPGKPTGVGLPAATGGLALKCSGKDAGL